MIVDAHTHWPVSQGETPNQFLDILDRYRIDHAVVSGLSVLYKLGRACDWNDRLVDFCAASDGRLTPLATVHLAEKDLAVTEAGRCLEQLGVKGFKFHPWLQGETIFCPAMYDICHLAAQHNVPLVFHDGTPPFSLPAQIGVLADMYPQTTFVLWHGGILYFWEEAIEVARKNSNVYITLCGGHPWAMQAICDQVDAERILCGSDIMQPDFEKIIPYRQGLINCLDLSPEHRLKITGANAMKLFGIPDRRGETFA